MTNEEILSLLKQCKEAYLKTANTGKSNKAFKRIEEQLCIKARLTPFSIAIICNLQKRVSELVKQNKDELARNAVESKQKKNIPDLVNEPLYVPTDIFLNGLNDNKNPFLSFESFKLLNSNEVKCTSP